jgi:hypothetical protein
MPRTNPVAPTRRFAADQRCESQLEYLRHVCSLAIRDGRPPSHSAIIRRAVARYIEHVADLIESGQLDGLPGPYPQDAAAEARALADYERIADAAPPVAFADVAGRLQPWAAAIQAGAMPPLSHHS